MSPTLLELVVVIIVIVVAWQIGLALAPDVFRLLKGLYHEVDEVTTEVLEDEESRPNQNAHKEGQANDKE